MIQIYIGPLLPQPHKEELFMMFFVSFIFAGDFCIFPFVMISCNHSNASAPLPGRKLYIQIDFDYLGQKLSYILKLLFLSMSLLL